MLLADHPFEYLTVKEFQVAGKNGPRPKIHMQEVKEDDAERQTHHSTKKQIGHLRLPEWEMREFQRFLLNLRAKYYLGTSNTFNFCRVINASERGLGVYLPVKLEVGQNLKLECVTSHAVGVIKMLTQIVWVNPTSAKGYQSGMSIIKISAKNRNKLEGFLKNANLL